MKRGGESSKAEQESYEKAWRGLGGQTGEQVTPSQITQLVNSALKLAQLSPPPPSDSYYGYSFGKSEPTRVTDLTLLKDAQEARVGSTGPGVDALVEWLTRKKNAFEAKASRPETLTKPDQIVEALRRVSACRHAIRIAEWQDKPYDSSRDPAVNPAAKYIREDPLTSEEVYVYPDTWFNPRRAPRQDALKLTGLDLGFGFPLKI